MADAIDTKIFHAVLEFASERYRGLARQMVSRLQRIPASGIFGGYRHKTLWDEYCHETQHGPHELLESAWETTLFQIMNEIINGISVPEAMLLSIATDGFEFETDSFYPNHDNIRADLTKAIRTLAGDRKLEKFDP